MKINKYIELFQSWANDNKVSIFHTEEFPSIKFSWEGDFNSYMEFVKQHSPTIMILAMLNYSNEPNRKEVIQHSGLSSNALTACGKILERMEVFENSLFAFELGMPKDGFIYVFNCVNEEILCLQEEFEELFSIVKDENRKANYELRLKRVEELASKIANLPNYKSSPNRSMKDDVARNYLLEYCRREEIVGTRKEILDAAYRISRLKY
nr:hypothetical protein [uncultured Carboxylicivirga sp.]